MYTSFQKQKTLLGEVYGIGKNTDNALGLGTWSGKEDDYWKYSELQKIDIPEPIKGISASLGCSIVWTDNGKFCIVTTYPEVLQYKKRG